MLETKIICKLGKLVTIKRRTVIRLDNLRNHKWQMHDVTLEGPLSQKSNAQSQLQEILSNHQSLLEHNVLLLHKSQGPSGRGVIFNGSQEGFGVAI